MILYSVCEYSRKERYAVLFVGNVGNPFPTNSVNSYIRNSALMGISGILYIFVGMWECGSIKKYFKQIYVFVKTFCKKISHISTTTSLYGKSYRNQARVWKYRVVIENKCGMVMVQSVNVGNVGNLFPTNYLILYSKNGVMMVNGR